MPSNTFHMSGLLKFSVTVNGGTEVTIGAATEITVVGQSETDELYDPEDLSFSEVIRREVAVQAEVTFREFDEGFGQQWLAGKNGTVDNSLSTESNKPARFDLTVKEGMTDYDNVAGSGEAISVTLENAYVDGDFPLLELSQGEYSEHSVTLRANGVVYERVSDAAT